MIIFLYGADTYRSRQKLNEIIEHYQKIHKSGLSLNLFEEENLDFQDFKNEVETASMFKEKKLLVLKDIFSDSAFKDEFLKQKERFAKGDDIILIYEKKKIPENDSLFRFLKKNSKSQEFSLLEGEKLENWTKKEFENYKTKIKPDALELFINYVGNNLWQAANEIKKLINYKNSKEINARDIELLVRPKIEIDIFKTIDAISEKKKDSALNLIHRHLEKGDNPLYLLTMINFQFRNLLEIKDLTEKNLPYYRILSQSSLHPFIVKKSLKSAGKFSLSELKKIYRKIFQADLAIKTGKREPETALDLLIAEI